MVVLLAVLTASGCVDVHDAGPCVGATYEDSNFRGFAPLVGVEFHRSYASRLDVDFGETAKLTFTIRNRRNYRQTFAPVREPPVFVVTTPDCRRIVWRSPWAHTSAAQVRFEPGEEKEFSGEWSLTDDWGQMVPPGDYIVHAVVEMFRGPNDWVMAKLVVFERVHVGEEQLRAARPKHPPVPPDPSCGKPTHTRVSTVMGGSEYEDVLYALDLRSAVKIFPGSMPILNVNREPTGVYGIRIVIWEKNTMRVNVPDCIRGVPLQVLIRSDP